MWRTCKFYNLVIWNPDENLQLPDFMTNRDVIFWPKISYQWELFPAFISESETKLILFLFTIFLILFFYILWCNSLWITRADCWTNVQMSEAGGGWSFSQYRIIMRSAHPAVDGFLDLQISKHKFLRCYMGNDSMHWPKFLDDFRPRPLRLVWD